MSVDAGLVPGELLFPAGPQRVRVGWARPGGFYPSHPQLFSFIIPTRPYALRAAGGK